MQEVDELTRWLIDHLVIAVLVLTRLSTLLMAMPGIGTGVPMRVRAMLALMITIMLVPTVVDLPETGSLPQLDNLIELVIAIAREALVGMLIGATIQLIVTGLQLGGELITGTGGMQLGDSVDPTTQSSLPTLAKLVGLLVTAILFAAGGHRLMMQLLLDSFRSLPAGNVQLDATWMSVITTQLTGGMIAGIRFSAPVIAALLLSNLITGLISRTLPQINVLAIGFSINAVTLLVVTTLAIGSVGYVFQSELQQAVTRLQDRW